MFFYDCVSNGKSFLVSYSNEFEFDANSYSYFINYKNVKQKISKKKNGGLMKIMELKKIAALRNMH